MPYKTKAIRAKIYDEALGEIIYSHGHMCGAVSRAVYEHGATSNGFQYIQGVTEERFPELFVSKPAVLPQESSTRWFNYDKQGQDERICALLSAISFCL